MECNERWVQGARVMKILLIHGDRVPWATNHRAVELKKRWSDCETDILLFTDDIGQIDFSTYDIIHCLFSGGISKLRCVIDKYHGRFYGTMASYRSLYGAYEPIDDLISTLRLCRGVVSQNQDLKAKLDALGVKSTYIPNGVDVDVFKSNINIGYVASNNANNDIHKGRLLIAQACKELGVNFTPHLNEYPFHVKPIGEMPRYYSSLSCLVIASESEGCNNPILEAMAMNIPVVATTTGIVPVLEGVHLVERTVESIKQGIRHAVPRIQILEKYTWDIIANQYRGLYVD